MPNRPWYIYPILPKTTRINLRPWPVGLCDHQAVHGHLRHRGAFSVGVSSAPRCAWLPLPHRTRPVQCGQRWSEQETPQCAFERIWLRFNHVVLPTNGWGIQSGDIRWSLIYMLVVIRVDKTQSISQTNTRCRKVISFLHKYIVDLVFCLQKHGKSHALYLAFLQIRKARMCHSISNS